MKGINCYLGIIIILLIFFCVILLCLRFSKFVPVNIPGINTPRIKKVSISEDPEIHWSDSRYSYPLSPPVNPIVKKSILKKTIPVNSDLSVNSEYTLNDSDNNDYSGNLLDYSGGSTELLQIPLQMNEPNSFEQLRSQDILITPYNRVKYSNSI